jgi:signal transduction histidine kinase
MLVDVENFKTEPVGWDDVLLQLNTIQDSTRHVLHSLRQLLHDLRGEETLGDSFTEGVAALVSRFEERTRINARFTVLPGWPETLTPPASANLYRIIEEALANVRMHSGANAVSITLQPISKTELSVLVVDDGRGVDTDARQVGLGTVGMKERAVLLGGKLQIESRIGDGTTVRGTFPRDLLTDRVHLEEIHA